MVHYLQKLVTICVCLLLDSGCEVGFYICFGENSTIVNQNSEVVSWTAKEMSWNFLQRSTDCFNIVIQYIVSMKISIIAIWTIRLIPMKLQCKTNTPMCTKQQITLNIGE